jgi:hypothetical protein
MEDSIENIGIIIKLYSLNIKNVISCLEGNMNEIYKELSSEDLSKYFVASLAFYIRHIPTLEGI